MKHLSWNELAAALGRDTAQTILEKIGGVEGFIPTAQNIIVAELGTDELRALCQAFGGAKFSFPRAPHQDAKEKLIELLSQGLPVAQAARQVGVSSRYGYAVKRLLRDG